MRKVVCRLTLKCSAALLVFINSTVFAESIKTTLVGTEISSVIKVDSKIIFQNSDSLFLNEQLLVRNVDYVYFVDSGGFVINNQEINTNDTLVVTYKTAPKWLAQSFGSPIPQTNSQVSSKVLSPAHSAPKRLQSTSLTDIEISGAKTFRFSSQTSGTSDFGQSLDLNITGKLTDDLKISGTISDRGYNPSYGTANSRLEELDKVNLKLESNNFVAQVGDIQIGRRLFQPSYSNKKISGAEFNLNSGSFGLNGVAARPKGRFDTYDFTGIDGMQGPYQIGTGSQARPIVPNSESVWLDGRLLVRGSDNDYVMDYPSGRITFSVKNQIDRRSRMEIDYEPVSTEYQTELLSAGSFYKVGDSSFYAAVEFYREGDNKNKPEIGELSDFDRQILSNAGDKIDNAVRSGIRVDTAGNYLFDSTALPDTVLQYVGDNKGDYSAVFSFVGANKGDYKFVGGKQYNYVGANSGDYLPVVKIPVPERTDFYTTVLGLNNSVVGSINAQISFSQNDKNLFSALDDSNNDGLLLNLDGRRVFITNGQESSFQFKLRSKEADYYSQSRINSADFSRRYMLPLIYSDTTDEVLYEMQSVLSPAENITLIPNHGRLKYKGSFISNRYGMTTNLGEKSKLNGSVYWKKTEADLLSGNRIGTSESYGTVVSTPIVKKLRLIAEYDNDNRRNNYSSFDEGLRYQRYQLSVERENERFTYEYYTEDSLLSIWSHFSDRNRITASSIRRLGKFSYNAYFGYQWIKRELSKDESFLSRTDFRYNDNRKQLNIETSYSLSDETRNARGITYLEVEPGQGNFIYENGRYIPDPDGNYIQVEELLSDRSRVNRGEKSFLFSKNWSEVQLRFNSKIEEELLENGSRDLVWLIPFFSDDNQPYLVYNRQYNSDIRLFRIQGGHAVNVSLDERTEHRNLSGINRIRQDRAAALTLKQSLNRFYFEEKLDLFKSDRDNYFIGGGEIDGYKIGGTIRKLFETTEYSFGGYFRNATSVSGEISKITALTVENRIRVIEKGEIRNKVELYLQQLENVTGIPSYLLTDNKPGNRGILWTSSFNYNLRKGMRINLRMSGRHSDITIARITGRAEVVAEF